MALFLRHEVGKPAEAVSPLRLDKLMKTAIAMVAITSKSAVECKPFIAATVPLTPPLKHKQVCCYYRYIK